MGLDVYLTVVPANEYRKCRANRDHLLPESLPEFNLFREWDGLDVALNNMSNPLNLAVRGNRPDDVEFGEDGYSAFVTPAMVKKIYKALQHVSGTQLVASLKQAGWRLRKHEQEYHFAALKDLKMAYRLAAKNSGCLWILMHS